MNFSISWKCFLAVLILITSIVSCKKEDQKPKQQGGQDDNIIFSALDTFASDDINIIVHSKYYQGLKTGYNEMAFLVMDEHFQALAIDSMHWEPVMTMNAMQHSCPVSILQPWESKPAFWGGFVVFQMASLAEEYWTLKLTVYKNGAAYEVAKKIEVGHATNRVVQSFKGLDDKNYVLALKDDNIYDVGSHPINAVFFEMVTMMEFKPVEGYSIQIDPRMPSMNNHSSPNNEAMVDHSSGLYSGKVNYTMTGYWAINMQVFDYANNLIKGETITDSVLRSSIYFDVAF